MTASARTGVLGGTFDPIHLGHLQAAEAARQALGLTTVLLVPSRVPPHRPTGPRASEYHRFAMVALATCDHAAFLASDVELRSTDPSYTSVTLGRLAEAGLDRSHLFFIAGADAFAEIATWHDYPAVLDGSHFVVVSRPGCAASTLPERLPELTTRMRTPSAPPDASLDQPAIWLVDAETPDVASTEVRRRLRKRRSVAGLVPDAVAQHIERHGLYESADPAVTLHER